MDLVELIFSGADVFLLEDVTHVGTRTESPREGPQIGSGSGSGSPVGNANVVGISLLDGDGEGDGSGYASGYATGHGSLLGYGFGYFSRGEEYGWRFG